MGHRILINLTSQRLGNEAQAQSLGHLSTVGASWSAIGAERPDKGSSRLRPVSFATCVIPLARQCPPRPVQGRHIIGAFLKARHSKIGPPSHLAF